MGLGLDLSGADTAGFEALPAGTYNAVVEEAEMEETQGGENAKLPAGTPMIAVTFKVTDDEEVTVERDGQKKTFSTKDRRAWRRYIIAPAKVNGKAYEHKAKMDGILVRFLTGIGYNAEEVTSGDFNLDVEDFTGRECRIVLGIREYEGNLQNEVKGVKPVGSKAGSLI